jgi:two-component system cell cycle sensor histidine kinase/response regulator CckA
MTVATIAPDQTGRELAEAAELATERRFQRLIEAALDIITVLGPDGTFRYQSPALERVLGFRPEELTGRSVFELIHPDDRGRERKAFDLGLSGSGVLRTSECRFRHKDGSWRVLEVVGRVIQDEKEGPSAVLNVRDITERKGLEEQLLQSQKMEAIGRLAGGIAHDFNNLLFVILGYAEALEKRGGGTAPGDEIAEIRKAAERAAALTRQLLAFSRRQVFERRTINVNTLLCDLDKMLRRLIGEDVSLTTLLDPNLGSVRADAGQIEQVIVNLAVNARDAMPDGGKLTIETRCVELDHEYARDHLSVRPGRYVMVAVSDTGTGMDDETKSKIFEPFFTTKEQGKGTGLGLATVYGIVKQSGGSIWFYSEPGRGTSFKVYLPEVAGLVAGSGRETAALPPERGSETILLTEDEEAVRTLTRKMLAHCGYTILEAASPHQALEIARRHEQPIDLLLTDVVMPEMGGSDLAARLQALRPETRVLYMSGYTDDVIVRHGVLEQGCVFLQKPFTAHALSRKVREALSAARSPVMAAN